MKLIERHLTGLHFLATVTDLLQRARLEEALAGNYEAADLQWWWREEDGASIPERQTFWYTEDGKAVATWLRFDAGKEWNHDFFCLPSVRPAMQEAVLPAIIAAIRQDDKPATLTARDDDLWLCQALHAAGFVPDSSALVQTELVRDPAPAPLPPGFRLTSRLEDQGPHHLARRSGPEVAQKLSECSLYRPDLDLCIRDASGAAAAYALFWMDNVTQVGLIEPVRTEAEFQRRGLARHLLVEGIARLRALGAESIRVSYESGNLAAANLYHGCGFVDRFQRRYHRWSPDRTRDA